MLGFIKRNVKFVVTIGVSALIIAGLTTALIVTNVGQGSAAYRERVSAERNVERNVELTEEQLAERVERVRERLERRLTDGEITQEEYDERVAALESGEWMPTERGGRGRRTDGGRDGGSRERSARCEDPENCERASRGEKPDTAEAESDLVEAEEPDEEDGGNGST